MRALTALLLAVVGSTVATGFLAPPTRIQRARGAADRLGGATAPMPPCSLLRVPRARTARSRADRNARRRLGGGRADSDAGGGGGEASWVKRNPAALASVCGGLFGLAPHASVVASATPAEVARFVASAAEGTNAGHWPPYLIFVLILAVVAASGATTGFATLRTLAASMSAFGLASQLGALFAAGEPW